MKKVVMKLSSFQNYGHCQLTYTSKNDAGQRLVYCLQDQGDRHGGIRLMRCSQDGEPSHEVKFTKVIAEFERPDPEEHDSDYTLELKRLCNAWIDRYESEMAS